MCRQTEGSRRLKNYITAFPVHSVLRSTRQRAQEHHSATRGDEGRLHPTPLIRLRSNYTVCSCALIHNEKPGARWPVFETLPDDTLQLPGDVDVENEYGTCTGLKTNYLKSTLV